MSNPESTSVRKTPLHDAHLQLGARMSPFAGYHMPVFYTGIYEEASAVRTACGIFDVSHMGRLKFGRDAAPFLQKLLTCDVSKLRAGTGVYGLVLNDDAGILDDIILHRAHTEDFYLVVNAANHAKISAWITSHGGRMDDLTDHTAMMAVQGPAAPDILPRALESCGFDSGRIASLGYFDGIEIRGSKCSAWVTRTGYTGEDGFEITLPEAGAASLWKWLVKTGNVTPCGLGSRDVLRIEAGYSLYGSDMDESTSPYDCGLKFAVAPGAECWGADTLRSRPVTRRLVGLDAGDSPAAVLRHGYAIMAGGKPVGSVTSGVFSKTLGRSIGFGSIDVATPDDDALSVDIRGRAVTVRRRSRRFIDGRVKARS